MQEMKKQKKGGIPHWRLYVMLLPPVVYLIIFKYWPIYGLQIAFREYTPVLGFTRSPWVGFKHFENFFTSHQFVKLLSNTLILGIESMILSIPCPIILALSLNSAKHKKASKAVQMITYAPYFISTVIIVSLITQFLATRGGMFNIMRGWFGLESINLLSNPKSFRPIYIISGIWQTTGYGAIIYLASLAGISPDLYEAAKLDGATIMQRIKYIDLPSVMPVAVILAIMNCGSIINVGFEKVLLLQNQMNMATADVISTYVYRIGIQNAQFSYSTAIGLFNSVVSVVLLLSVNWFSKKLTDTSLF
jgi:putative aldouronate transport system permease protein